MQVDVRNTALIAVDVQWDFLPGGALAVPDGDAILAPIARLVTRFQTVVATQDFHPPGHVSFASSHPGHEPYDGVRIQGHVQRLWPEHCVAGTHGAELHPDVRDASVALVLRKGMRPEVDSYSGFREQVGPDGRRAATGLAGWLRERGIRVVLLAGLARDVCVQATAIDAADDGFTTVLLDDLTRPVWPDRRADTDTALRAAGVSIETSDGLQF